MSKAKKPSEMAVALAYVIGTFDGFCYQHRPTADKQRTSA